MHDPKEVEAVFKVVGCGQDGCKTCLNGVKAVLTALAPFRAAEREAAERAGMERAAGIAKHRCLKAFYPDYGTEWGDGYNAALSHVEADIRRAIGAAS